MDNNFTQQYYKWNSDKRNGSICDFHKKLLVYQFYAKFFKDETLKELDNFNDFIIIKILKKNIEQVEIWEGLYLEEEILNNLMNY